LDDAPRWADCSDRIGGRGSEPREVDDHGEIKPRQFACVLEYLAHTKLLCSSESESAESNDADALVRAHLARTHDGAVGGLAGIGCGGCLHKIHRIGELHEAFSPGEVLVGESAVDRISRRMLWIAECGDPVSELEASHVRTDVRHDTGDFVAEHEGKVCQHPRQGAVDETYAVTDPGGPHVDDDLSRAEDPRARYTAAARSQR